MAGPKRPQDRVSLVRAATGFDKVMTEEFGKADERVASASPSRTPISTIGHGDVVIAAITSCTNTSNPSVMMAAGLLARNANKLGLKVKPWVKTSLAPGSQVVTEYLKSSNLQKDLDKLGFDLVGYGCTTCIGNSGPLPEAISEAIRHHDLVAASVLSGNRNFEGRVNPDVRANYLASPPLVVAYALAGSMNVDLTTDPLGHDPRGQAGLSHATSGRRPRILPSSSAKMSRSKAFQARYKDVFKGDADWRKIKVTGGLTYDWDQNSTYVQNPPYFTGMHREPEPVSDIIDARVLGLFLDSITTDHISPAGSIKPDSPAGHYLLAHGVSRADFNSYGARRGNHEVMMRGTFANIRIKNQMVPGVEGGVTIHHPSGRADADLRCRHGLSGGRGAAGRLRRQGIWHRLIARLGGQGHAAARRRAVIAQSFERIHRSNLIGMGVLPLQFKEGEGWQMLGLIGDEKVTIRGLSGKLRPRQMLEAEIARRLGPPTRISLQSRIDTVDELEYFRNGGILHYVLRNLAQAA